LLPLQEKVIVDIMEIGEREFDLNVIKVPERKEHIQK